MKLLAKTFPVLLIKIGCAQTPVDYSAHKIDFGFSSATFSGFSSNNLVPQNNINSDFKYAKSKTVSTITYGWKQGFFFWVNLSSCLAYRPEVNAVFGINNYKNLFSKGDRTIYSTSLGVEFKPQLIIRLGCWNSEPIIKLARNMSYYLTGKQSYLIVGPKFSYQKTDKAFSKLNNDKFSSFGFVFGCGADHLFPNLNVAPELSLSVEYKTGNYPEQKKDSNRYYACLSLAMNFY